MIRNIRKTRKSFTPNAIKLSKFAFFVACSTSIAAYSQAGGGGAGAGAGGSATAGATGTAAAQAAAANGQAPGAHGTAQAGMQDVSQAAQSYAAGSAAALDPRRPAPASPNALPLGQVLDRARTRNPTLLAAEANLRSVRAQEIQAAVRTNPYLGVAGSNVTEGSTALNPYQYSVQVSRLFERGNKRGIRIDNARATTTQTASQLEDTTRQTLLQVKTAFTHMLFAKQSLVLAQAQLTDFQHEVDIAQDRYKAGDLGKLDFERLDLQLGSFESDVANDQIAYEQASAQLQTLLGVADPSPTFEITGDIIPPLVTQTRDQLAAIALQSRPDLRAAQAGVNVAGSAYRLAVANGTADPTLEGEYDRSAGQNSFGFNANIPLRIFDRNQGNKETARISIDTARLTATAAQNQVVSDVTQAWSGYTRARAIADRFGNHYLDESADVLSIARFAFDHGGLTLIDYLDSLREARSSTSDALNAYQQTWLAIHQLNAATATELLP